MEIVLLLFALVAVIVLARAMVPGLRRRVHRLRSGLVGRGGYTGTTDTTYRHDAGYTYDSGCSSYSSGGGCDSSS